VITAFGALITAGAFVLSSPPQAAVDPQLGFGAILAVTGGAVASLASVIWVAVAPHSALHPLKAGISWGRLIGVAVSVLIVVVGSIAVWAYDGRTDVVLSPEDEARIAELEQEARESTDPTDATVIANDIANIRNQAQLRGAIETGGTDPEGPQLGIWTIVLSGVALLTTVPAIGIFGDDESRKWLWSSITAGVSTGVASIAFAWIFTFVRQSDPNFVTGMGSFFTMMGGLFMLASTMPVLKEFRRSRVYDDEPSEEAESTAEEPVEELV
jgi:hypothetical protein